MLSVSNGYIEATERNERKSYVIASYGSYDEKAKKRIYDTETNNQLFGVNSKLYNEKKETSKNYITCEPNRVKLDSTFWFLRDKNQSQTYEDVAYWSTEMSNSICEFDNIPKLIIRFGEIPFTELTLYFQEVCTHFVVNYYYVDNEGTSLLIASREITNNQSLVITTQGAVPYDTNNINKIEITFYNTLKPYRYIKLNEIDFGVMYHFTEKEILDYSIIEETSVTNEELSVNSMSLTINGQNGEYDILNPNNKLNLLRKNNKITLNHYLLVGNEYKSLPLGTFIINNIKYKDNKLELEAYSDIYYIDGIYYGSQFYMEASVTQILEELFEYFNYTNYEFDDSLETIKLTGYVPNVEFREALRLILEASQCILKINRYGKLFIYKLNEEQKPIKRYTRNLIDKENPSLNNIYSIIINKNFYLILFPYLATIYDEELDVGEHLITFDEKIIVVGDNIYKKEENSDYEIVKSYATCCIVNVTTRTKVVLGARIIAQKTIFPNKFENYYNQTIKDEQINIEIANTLITSNTQGELIANTYFKHNINYNFVTPIVPYIEVGDICEYETKYNTTNKFIPTRIEFTKSIIQNIEGV